MQALSLRGLHVHYSVIGPNSCFKKRIKFGTILLVRRGVDLYTVAWEKKFVSNFRVRSNVKPYVAA